MECSNKPCPNHAVVKGLCKTCYNYQYATGRSRPLGKPPAQTHCNNAKCGKPSSKFIKGRCPSCYRYWRKFGKDRRPRIVNQGALCENCHKRPLYAKQRCFPCYEWKRRHPGQERPDIPVRKGQERNCANPNCKKIVTNLFRCQACYRYWRKHGTERPLAMCEKKSYRHAKVKPHVCKVCKDPNIVSNGRCNACHSYYRRHKGKARPRHLWDKTCPCATCGVPLGTVVGRTVSGYCGACYAYRRYGKERPRHLWGIGPHGWCSCGRPAYHLSNAIGQCAICKDTPVNYPRLKPGACP